MIVILGRPGAGKTTLGKNLAERWSTKHVAAGDVARELAKTDPEVAAELEAGRVAPRDKMNEAMFKFIIENRGEGIILDGFPRYIAQLLDLYKATSGVFSVIYLTVPREVALYRLLARQRSDDTLAAINNRLDTFESETTPVIEWLSRRHFRRTHAIEGTLPPEKVSELARLAYWGELQG